MGLKSMLEQFVSDWEGDLDWHEAEGMPPGYREALARAKRLLEAWDG
jgi:hypothetical protein